MGSRSPAAAPGQGVAQPPGIHFSHPKPPGALPWCHRDGEGLSSGRQSRVGAAGAARMEGLCWVLGCPGTVPSQTQALWQLWPWPRCASVSPQHKDERGQPEAGWLLPAGERHRASSGKQQRPRGAGDTACPGHGVGTGAAGQLDAGLPQAVRGWGQPSSSGLPRPWRPHGAGRCPHPAAPLAVHPLQPSFPTAGRGEPCVPLEGIQRVIGTAGCRE